MKRTAVLIAALFISTACQAFQTEDITVRTGEPIVPERLSLVEGDNIKNVILLIGDGTGLAQITSGQLHLVGPDGLLNIQTMPVTGIVKTHSSDNLITDSAAGATAYSCGVKTYNGAIAVTDDKKPCKTILEMAEEMGLSTGLVATSSITHATPASFASHVESRSMEDEIAAQFLDSGAEVLLGGGMEYFSADERDDRRDLVSDFEAKGYEVMTTVTELKNSSSGKLLGLFADDGLERNSTEPLIADMTQKALEVLSKDEDGFFLMVEGSQIDWGGHANKAEYVLEEVRDFDQAVKAVLDFAKENGETLVVLTADHETGGMTLNDQEDSGEEMEIYWTTTHHTGIPVPVMAYGPKAIEFTGWHDNTSIGKKLAELLGVGQFPVIME